MNLGNKLVKEKVDSIKQLDRIELRQRVIIQQNSFSSWDCFYILGFISLFFTISYATTIQHLYNYGLDITPQLGTVRIFAMMTLVFLGFHLIGVLLHIIKRAKFNRENEDFIEEHSK